LVIPVKQKKAKKILVPTLGGPYKENLQIACELAKAHGADVTALCVIEIPATLPLDTFLSDRFTVAEATLKQAMAIGREYDLQITTQLLQARSAGQAIVDLAKDKGFDFIAIGSSYRRGASAWLGTTAEYILRNAPGRVLVCKSTTK
jgi:nucleotide-binding universal stress UspA family protein